LHPEGYSRYAPGEAPKPGFCQLAQLVETTEVIACVWLAVTGYTFDVIVRIDGEGRHRDVSPYPALAGDHIDHSEAGKPQGLSAG
jgi:hypothetical protein